MGRLALMVTPAIYLLVVLYLLYDCYEHEREPLWYLILLIPFYGVGLYMYRFKMEDWR